MKLYVDQAGTAPSPRRVRLYLAEKGLEVSLVRMRLHQENRTQAFREKNPLSTLPVLELEDGTCLAESVSICLYFEGRHPDPPLFGGDALERAVVDMWVRRLELYLLMPIELSHAGFVTGDGAEQMRGHAYRMMALLDRELTGREFVAGERYSMADIFALSALDFGVDHVGFEIPEKREHLRRWHAMVSARPSARA